MTDQVGALTVFYDGSCPLCSAEIGVYRNCAGGDRLVFIDVATSGAGLVAPGLHAATAVKRFHVRTANGSLSSGAEGFGNLWLALPAWRWLGRIVLLPGMLQVSEVIYRAFLLLRPALQWAWRVRSSERIRP